METQLISNKYKSIGIIIFLLLILGLISFCFYQNGKIQQLKIEESIKDNNIKALKDTVRTEANKSGEIQYSKQSLIATNKNLSDLNKQLGDEVKKQKGQIIFLSNSSGGIKIDTPKTIISNVKKTSDSEYIVTFDLENIYDTINYRSIKVNANIKIDSNKVLTITKSSISKDDIGFNIITGLKEENKNLRIFIRSDYPGLVFNKIDGALIDPRKSDVIKSFFPRKRWGVGIQAGVGIGINNEVKPCVFIGVGISYNLFTW